MLEQFLDEENKGLRKQYESVKPLLARLEGHGHTFEEMEAQNRRLHGQV